MYKLYKELERKKRWEIEKEYKFWRTTVNWEPPKVIKPLPREEMWKQLNDKKRNQNPISPLLSEHVPPRKKITPIYFGKPQCKFSFCKDKSKKKKFKTVYMEKRQFGNHLCLECQKIFLPMWKKTAYHYNNWYNYKWNKTYWWWFHKKRWRVWRATEHRTNYAMWFLVVEPRLGWWRTRKFFFWILKKFVSRFWESSLTKDDNIHWQKNYKTLFLTRVNRHLSIILYYCYNRLEKRVDESAITIIGIYIAWIFEVLYEILFTNCTDIYLPENSDLVKKSNPIKRLVIILFIFYFFFFLWNKL